MSSDTTSSSMATSTRQNMSAGPSPPASSATSSVKKPGQRSGKSTWRCMVGLELVGVGGRADARAHAAATAAWRRTRGVHSARSRAGMRALWRGVHGLHQACHSSSALSAGPVAGRLPPLSHDQTMPSSLPRSRSRGALHAAEASLQALRWQSRSQLRPCRALGAAVTPAPSAEATRRAHIGCHIAGHPHLHHADQDLRDLVAQERRLLAGPRARAAHPRHHRCLHLRGGRGGRMSQPGAWQVHAGALLCTGHAAPGRCKAAVARAARRAPEAARAAPAGAPPAQASGTARGATARAAQLPARAPLVRPLGCLMHAG